MKFEIVNGNLDVNVYSDVNGASDFGKRVQKRVADFCKGVTSDLDESLGKIRER